MSGRKYSRVELLTSVREALTCLREAEDAVRRAAPLAQELERAAIDSEPLRPAAVSIRATMRVLNERVASMTAEYTESHMMRLDPVAVRRRRDDVDTLRRDIEDVMRRCRDAAGAVAVRAEMSACLVQLEADRSRLEPWLGDRYASYVERTRALLSDLGATSTISSRVAAHAAELDSLRQQASERSALDTERRYVATALQRVCRDELGFTARLLPQSTPIEDLIVEVDTVAYGLMQFRLELDGTARSESEVLGSCPSIFGRIEDTLKTLGVVSAFRYEADHRPVRLEQAARELPAMEAWRDTHSRGASS
jgi:hypothetical protein